MVSESSQAKARKTPTEARAARRARRETRRRLRRFVVGGVITIVAILFIVALFLPGLSLGRSGGILGRDAPDGPGTRVEDQGRTHISPGQDHPGYNSVPATSGWHYPQPLAPAKWAVHVDSIPDEILVHNLEHGGIGVHYNCPEVCDDLVDQLAEIVRDSTRQGLKVIMSPYPEIGSKIAITAWNFIDKFDQFDEQRIRAFIESHERSPNAPEPTAR